jgi:hypothetical protein
LRFVRFYSALLYTVERELKMKQSQNGHIPPNEGKTQNTQKRCV